MTTHYTQAPLGFHPLCCLKNGHGMHARYLGKTKQTKTKDHSPSMTLSKRLPKQMILVPQNDKDTWHHCYHDYMMTHARPFTSKDKATYQSMVR